MKRLELLVENGPLSGRRFAVGEMGIRLGRSSSNDISAPDGELSRNHCLFEQSGETGIRLTDLASANGTKVNGVMLGPEMCELKEGDEIAVGSMTIRVVGEGPVIKRKPVSGGTVDLGLGSNVATGADETGNGSANGAKRSPVMNFIWAAVVALLIFAIYIVLGGLDGQGDASPSATVAAEPVKERVVEMSYEKVVANSETIFRYFMALSADGKLKVMIDDVPGENRHIDQTKKLDEQALRRLDEILINQELMALDRQYVGPDGEPPELRSFELNVVYSDNARSFSIVNTQEPDAFALIREKLETFAKNELGIWAMQRSRADLVKSAADIAETARAKWEERDVEYGNIDASIRAYREALVYLDTVNPKPPEYEKYRTALATAEKELDSRYREQRFKADRALNLGDWETAQMELQILCQMVPDRRDDRNREALAKLNDVERRMKGDR